MTLRRLVVAVAILAAGSAAADARQLRVDAPPDPRLGRLEYWLKTLPQHEPGDLDDRVLAVGAWANVDLRDFQLDASALVQLIHNPAMIWQTARVAFSFKLEGQQAAQPVRYTPNQVVRLKQLACAAGGLRDEPPCGWARASIASDPELDRLSMLAGAARHDGDDNFILRRGALLHADIAMLGVAAPLEPVGGAPSGSQSVRVTISDGRQTALTQSSVHWEIARRLLDQVTAPGSPKPAPERDAMVRLWYVATSAWMQHEGHHDNRHLDRGREIFSGDADLLLLTGAQHETYAGPSIQTAVQSAFLPSGIRIDVGSERGELREAEKYLRRALEASPEVAEAHLRLGRVLARTNRDDDARRELGRALELADEKVLLYYGALFLGGVEETLGHHEAAKASFERAAGLYPLAQSPRLALSELARRAGNRDIALGEIVKVFALPSDDGKGADPWWTYDLAQGRHAEELLELLRKPFRSGDEP